jgi:hypothetical protein
LDASAPKTFPITHSRVCRIFLARSDDQADGGLSGGVANAQQKAPNDAGAFLFWCFWKSQYFATTGAIQSKRQLAMNRISLVVRLGPRILLTVRKLIFRDYTLYLP